ncbi:glycoside hydrolase family 125 protein [Enterococcus gilvus]|uniref:glycoside hydrolase family 125 protein n=1 Tax=Enterococcus gilvus TaxID=160453 RepID=UPI0028D32547|nr:glycoside hydrolase family 125 protein [Enterococcus gilvus]
MIDQARLIKEIQAYAETVTLPTDKQTQIFRHAFVDTITNTVSIRENGEVFVATGDIPAMWLRDSTFQVLPYLLIAEKVAGVKKLIHGVLEQQLTYLLHDPYSNAFNKEADGGHYGNDASNIPISPLVWERKFEIDSLCAPFFLGYHLQKTGYTEHLTPKFWNAVSVAVETFIREQHHESSPYTFVRSDCPVSDTIPCGGKGRAIGYTGMVWSGFRPSDDACYYGYFIPGNQFIVVILKQLLELLPKNSNADLEGKMRLLLSDITLGIEKYGLLCDEKGNYFYAYEVDGLGNTIFMDDANVPSLLSLPFLGYCENNDPIYLTTRNKILSLDNPYYYKGVHLCGIGSPHTPSNYVWPISLAMEGLTSNNLNVIEEKLEKIAETDADTLQCHEGIDVDDPKRFTREWFSWANMTYCQLALHYLKCSKIEKI